MYEYGEHKVMLAHWRTLGHPAPLHHKEKTGCERSINEECIITHSLDGMWQRQYSLWDMYTNRVNGHSQARWDPTWMIHCVRQVWKHGINDHSQPSWNVTKMRQSARLEWNIELMITHRLDGMCGGYSLWDGCESRVDDHTQAAWHAIRTI